MNILIPHSWLLDHLETNATPKQIQEYLSLCGPSVEKTVTLHGQPVFDIEVTTNRVDAMSIRGIAREAAAILPEFGLKARLKPLQLAKPKPPATPLPLQVINDPRLCHRLVGIVMDAVTVGPSPDWLVKRLEQVGMRGLNNAIDSTNYAMHEIGHPIHAFDYDRIPHQKILIRQAKKGEHFTTLDGKTFSTVGGEIVFDDGDGNIIDLPGIMGTKNTVVTPKTKRVLLFVESSDPQKIRFASMTHAIRTQAAQLNEKQVDPNLALDVLLRAAELLAQLAGAKPASDIIDIYPQKPAISSLTLSQSRIDTYLGLEVKPSRIQRILLNLGCDVVHRPQDQAYTITPPTFRATDLSIEQDYIEEIARIYGYHNLPSTLMATPIPVVPTNINHRLEHQVKQHLAGWGLQEVYSYSLVSSSLALQSGHSLKQHLKLANPLTDDWVYLRRSLIPSHAEIIAQNKTVPNPALFELAHTYHPQKNDLPNHQLTLTVTTPQTFPVLKGYLEALAEKLFINQLTFTPASKKDHPHVISDAAGRVAVSGTWVGSIGRLLHQPHLVSFELDFNLFASFAASHPTFTPIPPTSPVIEDLTFQLPPRTPVGPVMGAIASVDNLINRVVLKSTFNQNYTFTIRYQHPQTQLSVEDIKPLRTQIVKALEKAFDAHLVGKL